METTPATAVAARAAHATVIFVTPFSSLRDRMTPALTCGPGWRGSCAICTTRDRTDRQVQGVVSQPLSTRPSPSRPRPQAAFQPPGGHVPERSKAEFGPSCLSD